MRGKPFRQKINKPPHLRRPAHYHSPPNGEAPRSPRAKPAPRPEEAPMSQTITFQPPAPTQTDRIPLQLLC
jgi:hypothetical protein